MHAGRRVRGVAAVRYGPPVRNVVGSRCCGDGAAHDPARPVHRAAHRPPVEACLLGFPTAPVRAWRRAGNRHENRVDRELGCYTARASWSSFTLPRWGAHLLRAPHRQRVNKVKVGTSTSSPMGSIPTCLVATTTATSAGPSRVRRRQFDDLVEPGQRGLELSEPSTWVCSASVWPLSTQGSSGAMCLLVSPGVPVHRCQQVNDVAAGEWGDRDRRPEPPRQVVAGRRPAPLLRGVAGVTARRGGRAEPHVERLVEPGIGW